MANITFKNARINENGFAQIKAGLVMFHKLSIDKDGFEYPEFWTDEKLRAFAIECEDHYNDGSGCYFELVSFDTQLGQTVIIDITADGFDVVEVDCGEE